MSTALITAFATVAGGAVLAVGGTIARRALSGWRSRKKREREIRAWLLGVAEVPGVSEAVAGAPLRLEQMGKRLEKLEATAGATYDLVVAQNARLDRFIKDWTPNGENTNKPGDVLQRMARNQGVLLPEDEVGDSPRRRRDDERGLD